MYVYIHIGYIYVYRYIIIIIHIFVHEERVQGRKRDTDLYCMPKPHTITSKIVRQATRVASKRCWRRATSCPRRVRLRCSSALSRWRRLRIHGHRHRHLRWRPHVRGVEAHLGLRQPLSLSPHILPLELCGHSARSRHSRRSRDPLGPRSVVGRRSRDEPSQCLLCQRRSRRCQCHRRHLRAGLPC